MLLCPRALCCTLLLGDTIRAHSFKFYIYIYTHIHILCFFFLATLLGLQDLSSLTRDGTQAHCSGSAES